MEVTTLFWAVLWQLYIQSDMFAQGEVHRRWPMTVFEHRVAHYPCFCTFTDMVFKWEEKKFFYKHKNNLHSDCHGINVWPIENDPELKDVHCDEFFDIGYMFTIYYWGKSSNYFHLFVDLVIPLYKEIYFDKSAREVASKKMIFMPTVETKRLEKLNWETDAFTPPQDDKYWNHVAKLISGSHVYKPLDRNFLDAKKNICFRQAKFGTPAVDNSDEKLIRSMIMHIQEHLKIARKPFVKHKVGIITRSNRRRIINEIELLDVVRPIADVELVEFSGKTLYQQVQMMQDFSVLVGMNGAGLMNAIFLPPYATCVQLVPYKAQLNFVAYGKLLQTRGPYLEWHNKHEGLNVATAGDQYRNRGDTVVHKQEFAELIKKAIAASEAALNMAGKHQEL